jgi:large subunit ribosomal protein L4
MLKVYDLTGKETDKVEISPSIFNVEKNDAVIHEVLVAELANSRQSSANAKTRGEVRGGGRKPRKQKYTGMARQGSIRSPQWVGGGVVHGPTNEKIYTKKINRKVWKLAIKSVLSSKLTEDNIIILGDYDISKPNTKSVVKFLDKMKAEKSIFVLDDIFNPYANNIYYSARNIKNVEIIDTFELAVYWLLKFDKVILTIEALKKIERLLV